MATVTVAGVSKGGRCSYRMMESPSLTGRELRELVFDKWGRSYDVCIARRGSRCCSICVAFQCEPWYRAGCLAFPCDSDV